MAIISYGVCRLAIVPVRADASQVSGQVTQLLFGDHYEMLSMSPDRQWAYIRVYADPCEGWIDACQHHEISEEYFQQINKTEYKITTDVSTPILYKKLPLTIVMGSIVPISSSELFKIEEQFAFNGESKSLGQRRDAEFIRQMARKYMGAPYQWGGKSPFGIDATGLIHMIFKIAGYPVPRTFKALMNHGKTVTRLSETQPGDIAFFFVKGGEPVHCALILEADKVVHAFGQVRMDRITEEGILVPETKIYTHYLHSVRRIMQ
jgi:gamma-D-glutamyl-L-lysine dipeptidyl-peptidase